MHFRHKNTTRGKGPLDYERDSDKEGHANGKRQHGTDRSSGGRLLGRPDGAVAGAFRYRPRTIPAGLNPRLRNFEESLRSGESGAWEIASGESAPHRAGLR